MNTANHQEAILKEGWPIIGFCLILCASAYFFLNAWVALVPATLTLFSLYFFRNPPRQVLGGDNELVSPADGLIMDVTRVDEDRFLHSEACRIRIFLNIFNVHVNRIPLTGTVEKLERDGARYLAAYKDQAGSLNVRNYVLLKSDFGRILIVQITGLIARRLVCWVKPGDNLSRGERFGMIRFGSCTELYVDPDTEILVSAGERVKGGTTVLARINARQIQ